MQAKRRTSEEKIPQHPFQIATARRRRPKKPKGATWILLAERNEKDASRIDWKMP